MSIKTRIRKIKNKIKNRKRFDLQQVPLANYVVFSISVLIVYVIIALIFLGFEKPLDSDLTTCLFGFFGGEVVMCALIKIFKLKDVNDTVNDDKTSDQPQG